MGIDDEPVTDKCFPITGECAVTCVKCIPTENEEMIVVSQVEELLCTCRSVDDLQLESHVIWLALQSLTFGYFFNQSMENLTLPSGLQSLTFGENFDQSLENVNLPSGLQSLTFDTCFNQSMVNVALPSGLQSLTFGWFFNQSMVNVALPSG